MMSQHCHCPVKMITKFYAWVELLLTDGLRNGKTRNRQVCWMSAFPSYYAYKQINGDANAFSIAADVLAVHLLLTGNINSAAINVHPDCSLKIVNIRFISVFEESYTQCSIFVSGICDFDFEQLAVLNRCF
jgi:hypothetical protein